MLINFVNEGLTEEIVSDKPCTDFHDVNNLISLDSVKRGKGFLVENFVKPPVFVNLKFVCSITIKKIIVGCQVGIQKSSSIEVYTKQSDRTGKIIVAKKDLKETENFANFVLYGSQKKSSDCVTFRLSKYMCNVDEVCLRILKTQGSTLAAIGRIEIWGKPSKFVSSVLFKKVNDIWTNICCPSKTELEPSSSSPKKTIFRYCREIKIPDVDVPEEFIDPITCEILIIPMTLPSGKVVDASTLERFNEAEEKYGRLPSDPFTGCIFTETKYPVIATALKARLDKFLLDYSHIPRLKSVPRTVGRIPGTQSKDLMKKYEFHSTSLPSTSQENIKTVDQLLESCLNGLPSFLEKPSEPSGKIECYNCGDQLLLFKLNCNDLICRSCLVSFKSQSVNLCVKCKQPIDFKKAERFHLA